MTDPNITVSARTLDPCEFTVSLNVSAYGRILALESGTRAAGAKLESTSTDPHLEFKASERYLANGITDVFRGFGIVRNMTVEVLRTDRDYGISFRVSALADGGIDPVDLGDAWSFSVFRGGDGTNTLGAEAAADLVSGGWASVLSNLMSKHNKVLLTPLSLKLVRAV